MAFCCCRHGPNRANFAWLLYQIVFKTLPSTKVGSVELGGLDGPTREKIFVAAGAEVKGYSKKGKQFLCFETNLTDPIQNM